MASISDPPSSVPAHASAVMVAAALYKDAPGSPSAGGRAGTSHRSSPVNRTNGDGPGSGRSVANGHTNGNGTVSSPPQAQPRQASSKKGHSGSLKGSNKGTAANGRGRRAANGAPKGARRAMSQQPNGHSNGAVDISPARVAEVARRKKADEQARKEELIIAERQLAAMKRAEFEAAVEFRQAKQNKRSSNRDASPTRTIATNGAVANGKSSSQTLSPSSATSSHHSNLSVSSSPPVLSHSRQTGTGTSSKSTGSPYSHHQGPSPYAWPSPGGTLLERQAKAEEERHQARVYAYKQRIIQLQTEGRQREATHMSSQLNGLEKRAPSKDKSIRQLVAEKLQASDAVVNTINGSKKGSNGRKQRRPAPAKSAYTEQRRALEYDYLASNHTNGAPANGNGATTDGPDTAAAPANGNSNGHYHHAQPVTRVARGRGGAVVTVRGAWGSSLAASAVQRHVLHRPNERGFALPVVGGPGSPERSPYAQHLNGHSQQHQSGGRRSNGHTQPSSPSHGNGNGKPRQVDYLDYTSPYSPTSASAPATSHPFYPSSSRHAHSFSALRTANPYDHDYYYNNNHNNPYDQYDDYDDGNYSPHQRVPQQYTIHHPASHPSRQPHPRSAPNQSRSVNPNNQSTTSSSRGSTSPGRSPGRHIKDAHNNSSTNVPPHLALPQSTNGGSRRASPKTSPRQVVSKSNNSSPRQPSRKTSPRPNHNNDNNTSQSQANTNDDQLSSKDIIPTDDDPSLRRTTSQLTDDESDSVHPPDTAHLSLLSSSSSAAAPLSSTDDISSSIPPLNIPPLSLDTVHNNTNTTTAAAASSATIGTDSTSVADADGAQSLPTIATASANGTASTSSLGVPTLSTVATLPSLGTPKGSARGTPQSHHRTLSPTRSSPRLSARGSPSPKNGQRSISPAPPSPKAPLSPKPKHVEPEKVEAAPEPEPPKQEPEPEKVEKPAEPVMSDVEREFAEKKEAERLDNERWQIERKKWLFLCRECGNQAEVRCSECNADFCLENKCDAKIHDKKPMKKHKRLAAPLLWEVYDAKRLAGLEKIFNATKLSVVKHDFASLLLPVINHHAPKDKIKPDQLKALMNDYLNNYLKAFIPRVVREVTREPMRMLPTDEARAILNKHLCDAAAVPVDALLAKVDTLITETQAAVEKMSKPDLAAYWTSKLMAPHIKQRAMAIRQGFNKYLQAQLGHGGLSHTLSSISQSSPQHRPNSSGSGTSNQSGLNLSDPAPAVGAGGNRGSQIGGMGSPPSSAAARVMGSPVSVSITGVPPSPSQPPALGGQVSMISGGSLTQGSNDTMLPGGLSMLGGPITGPEKSPMGINASMLGPSVSQLGNAPSPASATSSLTSPTSIGTANLSSLGDATTPSNANNNNGRPTTPKMGASPKDGRASPPLPTGTASSVTWSAGIGTAGSSGTASSTTSGRLPLKMTLPSILDFR